MKASEILLEASEDIHMTGQFDDAYLSGEKWIVSKYCALGLLRCKGGYYSEKNGDTFVALAKAGLSYEATHQRLQCPECGQHTEVKNAIIHLNDDHHATFKQIGEFLKELGY